MAEKPQKKPVNPPKILDGSSVTLFGFISLPSWLTTISWCLINLVRIALLLYILERAYEIRTYAIRDYGKVIHEFDPWFNFRATQYLEREGWTKFFSWFDYQSWYPLGRPVGTTIYPGMQITSVLIYRSLHFLNDTFHMPSLAMSLNDVCVYVPAWFGSAATLCLALLTYECSGSIDASLFAAAIMSIIPAHIMRSVGGGYDNESVAMTAMLLTFFLWTRTLRSSRSWPWAVLAGLSYVFMVATWGGYIFVINMIGVHAGLLLGFNLLRGVHCSALYRAYTLFFVIGTCGATFVPVVGLTPFKSLEQIGPLAVFALFQLLQLSASVSSKLGYQIGSWSDVKVKLVMGLVTALVLAVVVALLMPTGFFGPLSARVRGLFVKHTRTGNPLVDSVAEHQPANPEAFRLFLHHAYYTAQAGLGVATLNYKRWWQSSFLILFCIVVYFFCLKMSRLLLLAAPVAASLSGIALGFVWDWCWSQILLVREHEPLATTTVDKRPSNGFYEKYISPFLQRIHGIYNHKVVYFIRLAIVAAIVAYIVQNHHYAIEFKEHSYETAEGFSEPSLLFKFTNPETGVTTLVDDYMKAYKWLREKTPKDARVMAWWDYGYQITGIGERTTIADGNTWNHEHIATLGYCLASPTAKAHTLIRHLADYVLVWSGGYQDDLAKSPHMARIGNSVYNDLCGKKDPTCDTFSFTGRDQSGVLHPTPMMSKSLLFNLISTHPNAYVNPKYFTKAFGSKYDLVRIYKVVNVSQESKDWIKDPSNRVCDFPGSWYCVGNYPPAEPIQSLLKKRTPFKQVEDFNKGGKNEEYHEEYMRKMERHEKGE